MTRQPAFTRRSRSGWRRADPMGKLKGMDSPPGRAAPHLVADFVELMCAANVDGEWGVSDLRALRKAKDKDHATVRDPSDRELLLGEDDPDEDHIDVAVAAALDMSVADRDNDDSEDDAGGGEDEPANADPGPAAGDDMRSTEGSEIADVLSYRSTRFQEAWPFELFDEDNLRLREPLEATPPDLPIAARCVVSVEARGGRQPSGHHGFRTPRPHHTVRAPRAAG